MKLDAEVKQLLKAGVTLLEAGVTLLEAGAKLLIARADYFNYETTRLGGKPSAAPPNEPQPDVVPEGKPETTTDTSSGVNDAEPSASESQDQLSSSSKAPSPPPPPNTEEATPPPPPPPPNSEEAPKPGKKITKARATRLNADMVEVAKNLDDDKPVRDLLLAYGVTTPAKFTKEQADAFAIKLKEL